MEKNRFGSFPLPDWIQSYLERNAGRQPVWDFTPIPDTPEGLYFRQVDFHNRHHLLEMFEGDPSPWVDERFKTPKEVYEYVCHLRIVMPYSYKRGGCDWLVFTADHTPAGLLHMYNLTKEKYGYRHRYCEVGFAFAKKFRGSGVPQTAMRQMQDYLFRKFDLLYLFASTKQGNVRSVGFLEKLGYENRTPDYFSEDEKSKERMAKLKEHYFNLFRSPQARGRILNYRNTER